MLCVIFGAHLLLFSLVSLNDNRRARRPEETPGILFFVELPKPDDPQLLGRSSSLESRATADTSITPPPEIVENVENADAFIDWDAEASRIAGDVIRREGEEPKVRPLDQRPAGMGPPPPKSSRHQLGDSQHFEGGLIIDWINEGCYYSNQDVPIAAFGQALRLQTPVCTGARGAGGKPLPSIEDWKKERENQ